MKYSCFTNTDRNNYSGLTLSQIAPCHCGRSVAKIRNLLFGFQEMAGQVRHDRLLKQHQSFSTHYVIARTKSEAIQTKY